MFANKPCKKHFLSMIGVIVFGILAVVSSVILISGQLEQVKAQQDFEMIQKQILPVQSSGAEVSSSVPLQTPRQKYQTLIQKNSDFAGWISIENTSIHYPVMQTPSAPDYYLNHNFQKQPSAFGVPYADARVDLAQKNETTIVYGHHTKNNGMFGALLSYQNENYCKEHPLIQFDTLEEFRTYQIALVFQTSVEMNSADSLDYTRFLSVSTEDEFNSLLQQCFLKSFYQTGNQIKWEDGLLILATCEYSQENSRFIVIAKRIGREDKH